jgi:signal transduction histidine kinase
VIKDIEVRLVIEAEGPTVEIRRAHTGLGLAISKYIVDLHGGMIKAESLGGGPRFDIHGDAAVGSDSGKGRSPLAVLISQA